MPQTTDYLALDLGAESGRGLLGRFDGERLALDEVHRFPNGPVRMLDTLHWDLPRLFDEMKTALRKAAAVDPGPRRRRGRHLGRRLRPGRPGRHAAGQPGPLPRRPHRGDDRGRLPGSSLASGSTRSPACNSCRSTRSISSWRCGWTNSPLLEVAETLLMMPDLFGWLLTGRRARRADRRLDDAAPRPEDRHVVGRALPALGLPRDDPARADRAGDGARAVAASRSPRRWGSRAR